MNAMSRVDGMRIDRAGRSSFVSARITTTARAVTTSPVKIGVPGTWNHA